MSNLAKTSRTALSVLEKKPMWVRMTAFIAAYLGMFVVVFAVEFVILKLFGDNGLYICLGFIAVWLAAAYFVFSAGGTWVATVRPDETTTPLDLAILKQNLLALDKTAGPFRVFEKKKGKQLWAEWRIEDVAWTEVIERAGLDAQYHIVMEFDEKNKVVRALDLSREIKWRSGLPGLSWSVEWFRGIDFYEFNGLKTFGLVRDGDNWKVESDYIFKFDRQEMKNPIIQCITESGWTYKPVLFLGGPLAVGT